ncbi:MAG: hypothetical protein ACUVR3_14090 [Candidatus Roseilinea sp.]|uniref:hypothetical protein n=1 Tax=Candidatus Roseilinea sp. TaxID=2838777 RepID=UPI00404A306B
MNTAQLKANLMKELEAEIDVRGCPFEQRVEQRDRREELTQVRVSLGQVCVESAAKQVKSRLQNMLPLCAALMSKTFDQLWPCICPHM